MTGNPVSVHHSEREIRCQGGKSGIRKSGVSSPFLPAGKSGVSSSFLPEKMKRHRITRPDYAPKIDLRNPSGFLRRGVVQPVASGKRSRNGSLGFDKLSFWVR